MPDKYFLDTNILIYTVGNVTQKKIIAVNLISPQAIISTQIIAESINVMSRKLLYDYKQIRSIIHTFINQMTLHSIIPDTIQSAIDIAERYGYSYYDSQVIARALEHHGTRGYSEDLQQGQVIEAQLKSVNPFL